MKIKKYYFKLKLIKLILIILNKNKIYIK